MPHGHDHASHSHDGKAHAGHAGADSGRRSLAIAFGLTSIYLVAEAVGGWLTNSLALIADAGHMLTDAASLALALFAAWLATRPAPPQRTFGYHRAEILAALANGAALLAACGWIAVESIRRFNSPAEVLGPGMFAVACGGLVVNLVAIRVLHGGHAESLNVRGAWLHVIADALGSVGAIAAAALIWAFGWTWADPAASLLIVLLILGSTWRLLAEAVGVLMESAPRGIDVDEVRSEIAGTPGVIGLHDLHVWSITTGRACLSVHVVASDEGREDLLNRLRRMLHERFGIDHTTIQIEPDDFEECGITECGLTDRTAGMPG